MEIQLENQKTMEITMKYQWKSSCHFKNTCWNCKSSWNFNDISMKISMKCLLKLIGNPVEISTKYQLKCNGNPLEIKLNYQWNTNGNSMKTQLKFNKKIQWNGNMF